MGLTKMMEILYGCVKEIILCTLEVLLRQVDVWRLKDLCNNASNEYLHRIYGNLYVRRLQRYGAWIGVRAQFKSIPILPHGLCGIFISGESKVGKDCVIFQHVTIGSNTLTDSKTQGAPEIGDSVYIGAGTRIIGGIKIGNNVRVGANSVVVEDIPDNCVVTTPKPRVIQKENLDNRHRQMDLNGQWGYLYAGGIFELSDE